MAASIASEPLQVKKTRARGHGGALCDRRGQCLGRLVGEYLEEVERLEQLHLGDHRVADLPAAVADLAVPQRGHSIEVATAVLVHTTAPSPRTIVTGASEAARANGRSRALGMPGTLSVAPARDGFDSANALVDLFFDADNFTIAT